MNLLASIFTVGGYTLASRVLGFIRDILIAHALGTGLAADAFFVSQRFPNLFRSLFAEGAFNAAFVPQYARRLEGEGSESARRFAEQVMSVMTVVLLVFTFIAQAGMPWLMYLLAGGYADDPPKFALSVLLTQVTFPYLLFMSLTALQGGILNSLHQFMHAAAAPILLNIVMIVALVIVAPFALPFDDVAYALAWAMTVAGVGQFLWMVIACHRAGMDLHLPRPRLTPEVRQLFRLMLPGIIGSGVMQLNLVIGTQIASWQDGAVSYLYYADRVYQFPLAVVGSATGVVLLPVLSRHLRAGEDSAAMGTLNRGIELVLLLTVPAAVALIAIPLPIVSVLFQHGNFTAQDSLATAIALGIYGAGLPAFVLVKALTPAFYAREDTATPFRYAIISMIVNTILSVLLFQFMAFAGIALGTVIASWLNIGMLSWRLHKRGHLALDARLRARLPRILISSLLMGFAVWFAAEFVHSMLPTGPTWTPDAGYTRRAAQLFHAPHAISLAMQAISLAGIVLMGVVVFAGASLLTGAASLAEFRSTLGRRRQSVA
jgi:putative peptidoglycan lipid II flippase